MNNFNKAILSTCLVMLIVVATVAVSYAYFSAFITGNETTSTISVTAGKMTLAFADNSTTVQTPANIYPRAEEWVAKTFSITGTNTTDLTMYYTISLVIDNNTFTDNALSYTLTGTKAESDQGQLINASGTIAGTSTISLGNGAKGHFAQADGLVHSYTLRLFFLDNEDDQNDDQEAKFACHIVIDDGEE